MFALSMGGVSGSRPARALWIEIISIEPLLKPFEVEAREGLVD